MEALRQADISRYPDSEARYLKRFLAERLGISSDNIFISSGSTELTQKDACPLPLQA